MEKKITSNNLVNSKNITNNQEQIVVVNSNKNKTGAYQKVSRDFLLISMKELKDRYAEIVGKEDAGLKYILQDVHLGLYDFFRLFYQQNELKGYFNVIFNLTQALKRALEVEKLNVEINDPFDGIITSNAVKSHIVGLLVDDFGKKARSLLQDLNLDISQLGKDTNAIIKNGFLLLKENKGVTLDELLVVNAQAINVLQWLLSLSQLDWVEYLSIYLQGLSYHQHFIEFDKKLQEKDCLECYDLMKEVNKIDPAKLLDAESLDTKVMSFIGDIFIGICTNGKQGASIVSCALDAIYQLCFDDKLGKLDPDNIYKALNALLKNKTILKRVLNEWECLDAENSEKSQKCVLVLQKLNIKKFNLHGKLMEEDTKNALKESVKKLYLIDYNEKNSVQNKGNKKKHKVTIPDQVNLFLLFPHVKTQNMEILLRKSMQRYDYLSIGARNNSDNLIKVFGLFVNYIAQYAKFYANYSGDIKKNN